MRLTSTARAVGSYLLVALATVAGIVGTGLLFTAATDGPPSLILAGLPLLLVGLYWSGRALGQSQELAQARHRRVAHLAAARDAADVRDKQAEVEGRV